MKEIKKNEHLFAPARCVWMELEQWAQTEKATRAILFTMQYCTPKQLMQLATDFAYIYKDQPIGLNLVNQLLQLHGLSPPTKELKIDYGACERETFKEIKAFAMSLKHQMFVMPAAVTFHAKQASINRLISMMESLLGHDGNVDKWYMSGEVCFYLKYF